MKTKLLRIIYCFQRKVSKNVYRSLSETVKVKDNNK